MKLKTALLRTVSPWMICSFLALPAPGTARAERISTEAFLAGQAQTQPRDRLLVLLEQQEVIAKLGEYGVTPAQARERIASMTDAEVAKLNQQVDQLPGGASAAGAILGTALAVFVILLITDILCWTRVFSFTRCAR